MSASGHRLFVALWPTDELRRAMEERTRPYAASGRPIPAANLHLTLAFLGSVPDSRIDDARVAIANVAVQPFGIVLKELQWWQSQALVCWAPEPSAALLELVQRLHSALRSNGFELEDRAFKAHVTVVRDAYDKPELKPISELRWQVQTIELIESRRPSNDRSAGSVYRIF
ncbi:MAG TPA: RNA 2',3'-cyclic phosphodiesterase [Steroidobacteraceae bacterium]|nr:RNA 2',3'-cyclic phosphodiesterase [Steroidobacteraceae bacterium]